MKSPADVDCVIIGAGAAGVAAGRALRQAGCSFLILEARQRTGGRASTSLIEGFPLDLGCGWLHSAERNLLVPMAEAAGFAIDREKPPWQKSADARGFETSEQRAYRAEIGRFYTRVHEEAEKGRDRPVAELLDPQGAGRR